MSWEGKDIMKMWVAFNEGVFSHTMRLFTTKEKAQKFAEENKILCDIFELGVDVVPLELSKPQWADWEGK
jgi:hypothetical protein